jgi:MFS transporter, DHA3 family, macrolide efflux protein
MPDSAPPKPEPSTLEQTRLWNRDFTIYLLGVAQSALGSALSSVALSFLTLEVTGSVGAMGLTLALGLLPGLFAPLMGTLIDRIPLRIPLILGDVLHGLFLLIVAFLATRAGLSAPIFYGFAFLNGILGTLSGPASSSLLPHLVPKSELARASGLLGMANQSMSLIGLLAGGFMVGKLGSVPSLVIDGLTFWLMAFLYLFIKMPAAAAVVKKQSFVRDLLEGFSFVRGAFLVGLVCIMAFLLNATFAPIQMLMPAHMVRFGVGAEGYSVLMALLTVGMLLGSVLLSSLGSRLKPALGTGLGLGILALGMLVFASSNLYALFLAGAALLGLGMAFTNTSIGVLLMTLVPVEMRGRTFALLGAVGQAGMPLTLLLLSPFADRIPFSSVFWTAGLCSVGMTMVWFVFGYPRAARSKNAVALESGPL